MKYKRAKFGSVPGDLSKHVKIAMLESMSPIQISPWQTIGVNAIKSFRKDMRKKANRQVRRSGKSSQLMKENG